MTRKPSASVLSTVYFYTIIYSHIKYVCLDFYSGFPALKKTAKDKICTREGEGANKWSKDGRQPASTGPMVKRR